MSRLLWPEQDCGRCPWLASPVDRCSTQRNSRIRYWSLDLGFGTVLGVLVFWIHDLLTPHATSLVWSLAISMVLVMGAQTVLSLLIGALTGSMEAMIPGAFVAMAAMSVAALPIAHGVARLVLAAGIGLVTTSFFVLWDAIRDPDVQGAGRPRTRRRASSTSFTVPIPAGTYDVLESAGARRRACFQRKLFERMEGKVLFVAAGTGLNFANFPTRREIVAIDVAPAMLERAGKRARRYQGRMMLLQADVQALPFPDGAFDTVATASTFCSVPDPDRGLSELYRVLKPGGLLLMFEHVRSRNLLLALAQDMMNIMARHLGPNVNRDTVGSACAAGFVIDRITGAYLDVFLAVEGHKPPGPVAAIPAL